MGKDFNANIQGKDYYLGSTSTFQQGIDALNRILVNGPIAKEEEPGQESFGAEPTPEPVGGSEAPADFGAEAPAGEAPTEEPAGGPEEETPAAL
jgi:hypothetical protein